MEARKDGYAVTATKGRKTAYWCFGMDGDKRVLKVVNRRVLPIQVAHADAPEVPPGVQPSKAWLPWAGVSADQATFLTPGKTVTYDVDLEPTKRALVTAASDSTAQSMQALYATTAALVARQNGFGGRRFKTVDTVALLVARPQCAKTLGQGSDKMLAGCFSRKKMMTTFGTTGLLLSQLTTAPTTKAFLRQQFKNVALYVQKNVGQNILVRRAKPDFSKFAGAFNGEARSMVVNAQGVVFESVNNIAKDGTLTRVADLTYQLSEPRVEDGVAQAQAVITKVEDLRPQGVQGPHPAGRRHRHVPHREGPGQVAVRQARLLRQGREEERLRLRDLSPSRPVGGTPRGSSADVRSAGRRGR